MQNREKRNKGISNVPKSSAPDHNPKIEDFWTGPVYMQNVRRASLRKNILFWAPYHHWPSRFRGSSFLNMMLLFQSWWCKLNIRWCDKIFHLELVLPPYLLLLFEDLPEPACDPSDTSVWSEDFALDPGWDPGGVTYADNVFGCFVIGGKSGALPWTLAFALSKSDCMSWRVFIASSFCFLISSRCLIKSSPLSIWAAIVLSGCCIG